jgi:hypothetical protein
MSTTRKTVVYRHGRRIEVLETIPDQPPQHKVPTNATFIKIPAAWIEGLVGESTTVYDLALLILQLDFKRYGHPVRLSNEATQHLGMARTTKRRGLRRLAKLGLISVLHKPGSAPLVTILR